MRSGSCWTGANSAPVGSGSPGFHRASCQEPRRVPRRSLSVTDSATFDADGAQLSPEAIACSPGTETSRPCSRVPATFASQFQMLARSTPSVYSMFSGSRVGECDSPNFRGRASIRVAAVRSERPQNERHRLIGLAKSVWDASGDGMSTGSHPRYYEELWPFLRTGKSRTGQAATVSQNELAWQQNGILRLPGTAGLPLGRQTGRGHASWPLPFGCCDLFVHLVHCSAEVEHEREGCLTGLKQRAHDLVATDSDLNVRSCND
jgi:hypothetical protein